MCIQDFGVMSRGKDGRSGAECRRCPLFGIELHSAATATSGCPRGETCGRCCQSGVDQHVARDELSTGVEPLRRDATSGVGELPECGGGLLLTSDRASETECCGSGVAALGGGDVQLPVGGRDVTRLDGDHLEGAVVRHDLVDHGAREQPLQQGDDGSAVDAVGGQHEAGRPVGLRLDSLDADLRRAVGQHELGDVGVLETEGARDEDALSGGHRVVRDDGGGATSRGGLVAVGHDVPSLYSGVQTSDDACCAEIPKGYLELL